MWSCSVNSSLQAVSCDGHMGFMGDGHPMGILIAIIKDPNGLGNPTLHHGIICDELHGSCPNGTPHHVKSIP